jgi:hypothetical protein
MPTELDSGGMLTALFQLCGRRCMFVCSFVHEALCLRTGGIGFRNNSVGVDQAFADLDLIMF